MMMKTGRTLSTIQYGIIFSDLRVETYFTIVVACYLLDLFYLF